jgi:septum formation protein
MLVTVRSPSSIWSRGRITRVERLISRAHCALVTSTTRTVPSSFTAVTRSSTDPTAVFHAKAILPSDIGASRRISAIAPGTADVNGFILTIIAAVRLILASASPRRAELLRAAGFEFETIAADVDERVRPGESPTTYVRRLAADKSAAVHLASGRHREPANEVLTVAADTAVILEDQILGKPKNDVEAGEMLRQLAGRRHNVVTGLSLRRGAFEVGRVEVTAVHFAPLTADDVAWYVASGEGRDKAGAYAIQGLASRFVTRIDGSYSNVVGLPVAAMVELMRQLA